MSALVPCTSCSRHVRAVETACPFCGGNLPADLASRAVPSTTRRLDRLATFTFAVGLTVAACGGTTGSDDSDTDPSAETADDEAELRKKKKKKDAGAPRDAGCVEQEFDSGGFQALYGMSPVDPTPPSPCATDAGGAADAGAPRDAGSAKDSGRVRDSGGIQPMYGMPWTPEDDDGGIQAMYGLPPTP